MSPAEQERLLADNMAMKPLSEGEVDHHWIDAYEVVCESQTTTIYMDMYHCSADAPAQAPANFRIIRYPRFVGWVEHMETPPSPAPGLPMDVAPVYPSSCWCFLGFS